MARKKPPRKSVQTPSGSSHGRQGTFSSGEPSYMSWMTRGSFGASQSGMYDCRDSKSFSGVAKYCNTVASGNSSRATPTEFMVTATHKKQ